MGDIKTRINIIIFITFFSFFILYLLNYNIQSMDEIWCYGFSYRFAEGYIPYKDFNIVVTPIFLVLGSYFSHSLFLFRVFGALLSACIILLTITICNKNNVDRTIIWFLVLINTLLLMQIPYATYNLLMLIGLMISYIFADKFFATLDPKGALNFGLCLAFTMLIKQNIAFLLIVTFFFLLLYLWVGKMISYRAFSLYSLGVLIPIFIFVLFLIFSGSFIQFVDYSILGLVSFSGLHNYQQGLQYIILICLLGAIFIAINAVYSKTDRLNITSTLLFCVCSFGIVVPLMDWYHTLLLLILYIPISSLLLNKIVVPHRTYSRVIVGVLVLGIMGISYSSLLIKKEGFIRSKIYPYTGIYISKAIENNLSEVSNYIMINEKKGLDVAIIDGTAYMYNLAAGDYNGVIDLLNIGNLGTINDEEINSIINTKDIILASKNYKWQDISMFKEYVSLNFVEIGTIGDKLIFMNPKSCKSVSTASN